MASTPSWKRMLETGMQFTELRRTQARELAAELVAQGHLARDQVQSAVDEIVEMSRRRREELRELVRGEVQRQLGALGLATKSDLARLERKLAGAPKATPRKLAKKAANKPAKKAAKKPAKNAAKKAAKKRARKPAKRAAEG